MHEYLKEGCKEDEAKLFSVVLSDRTRGNGHKVKPKGVHMSIRKHFFAVRVTDHWHRLLREVVRSPPLKGSLKILRNCLDVVLDNWL